MKNAKSVETWKSINHQKSLKNTILKIGLGNKDEVLTNKFWEDEKFKILKLLNEGKLNLS